MTQLTAHSPNAATTTTPAAFACLCRTATAPFALFTVSPLYMSFGKIIIIKTAASAALNMHGDVMLIK